MLLEALRIKLRNKIYIPMTSKINNKKIINQKFTIISNNCWGGTIYEAYNIQKQSPTVGLFFMAEDYIKFVSDLRGYLGSELLFIDPNESKWKDYISLLNPHFGNYPIGKLRDIEIHFLHYKNKEIAREKWYRRIKRIQWDHLLIKFNDQNNCTEKELEAFCNLPYEHKIFFTCKKWSITNDIIKFIPQRLFSDYILASYEPIRKCKAVDVVELINNL